MQLIDSEAGMTKFGFKMKLKPGFKEEYRRRHNELWPEVKKLLSDNGITDYSIFLMKKQIAYLLLKKLTRVLPGRT